LINYLDVNHDFPVFISNRRKKGKYIDRMIMHNKFKNISVQEAYDILSEKPFGDVNLTNFILISLVLVQTQ
jgi:hypothetical protein